MMDMLGVSGHGFNDVRHKVRAGPLCAATTCAAKVGANSCQAQIIQAGFVVVNNGRGSIRQSGGPLRPSGPR
jgi:hypothetical protein